MNCHSKYSKIKQVSIPKSTFLDLTDTDTPLQTPRLSSNNSFESQVTRSIRDTKCTATHDSFPEKVQEEEVGEIFGVILSRSRSVSSRGIKAEKQKPALLQAAVKRAFSMRRSSSISEGYCRIHSQSDFIADESKATTLTSRNTKKYKGKIFDACRLLLGL